MEKQKTRYRLDKKTGHLLEIPSKKQVRENVKKIREQKGKDQLPQSPVTIHETQAEKNFQKVQKVIDRMHAKAASSCSAMEKWLKFSRLMFA